VPLKRYCNIPELAPIHAPCIQPNEALPHLQPLLRVVPEDDALRPVPELRPGPASFLGLASPVSITVRIMVRSKALMCSGRLPGSIPALHAKTVKQSAFAARYRGQPRMLCTCMYDDRVVVWKVEVQGHFLDVLPDMGLRPQLLLVAQQERKKSTVVSRE